jgi:tetratricopeptide (TPR) repeat protein
MVVLIIICAGFPTAHRYKYELFICCSENEKPFAQQVNAVLQRGNIKTFFGEESVSWGGSVVMDTQSAIYDCQRALIIVSNSLLSKSLDLQHLVVSAFINRLSSKGSPGLLLPALLDVDQAEYNERCPFLSVYKPVKASLQNPEGLAKLVQKHLESVEDQTSNKAPPSGLPFSIRELYQGHPHLVDAVLDAVKSPKVFVCCIHGPPGVGKSRLATEAAHKLREDPDDYNIVYVLVEKMVTVEEICNLLLAKMAKHLPHLREELSSSRLQEISRSRDIKDHACAAILQVPQLCLVLDGCDAALENQSCFTHFLISMLDDCRHDTTIITTSCAVYALSGCPSASSGRPMKAVEVQTLSDDDSHALLKSWCSDKVTLDDSTARKFVRICDGMPMALQSIGAAMTHSQDTMEPRAILSYIHSTTGAGHLKQIDNVAKQGGSQPVSNCINGLYKLLEENLKQGFLCLSIFPRSFTVVEGAFLLNMKAVDFQLTVLSDLHRYGLLRHDGALAYSQHPLIHAFAVQEASTETLVQYQKSKKRYCELQLTILDKSWKSFFDNPKQALQSLRKHKPNIEHMLQLNISDFETLYDWFSKVAIHYDPMLVLAVSHRALHTFYSNCAAIAKTRGNSEVYAWIVLHLAALMVHAYDCRSAGEYLDKVSEIAVRGSQKLSCHYYLTEAKIRTALYQGKEAIDILSRQLQAEHSNDVKLNLLLAMGDAHFAQKDYDEAIDHYQQAKELLNSKETVHPVACTALVQIGRCFYHKREYKKSQEIFVRALDMQRLLGCDSVSLAATFYHTGISRGSVADQQEVAAALNDLKIADDATSQCPGHHLRLLAPQALGQLLLATGIQLQRKGELDTALKMFSESQKYFIRVMEECSQLRNRSQKILANAETLGYLALLDRALHRGTDSYRNDCLKLLRGISAADLSQPIFQTVSSDRFFECDSTELFAHFAQLSQSPFPAFVGYFDAITTGRWRPFISLPKLSKDVSSSSRNSSFEESGDKSEFEIGNMSSPREVYDSPSSNAQRRYSEAEDSQPGRPSSEVVTRNIMSHTDDESMPIQQLFSSYPSNTELEAKADTNVEENSFPDPPLVVPISGQLTSGSDFPADFQ